MTRVLVVDDEETQRDVLRQFLVRRGWEVDLASGGEEAVQRIEDSLPDAVVMDVFMPRGDGRQALKQIVQEFPDLPVILMTAFGNIRDAVNSMKSGAIDYLTKPIDLHELVILLENIVGRSPIPSQDPAYPPLPANVVAESPTIKELLSQLALVAPTDATVLVTGESGTGKEVFAELTHLWSPRRGGPLIRVNVAAIPPNLIEREIFGHVKGAYTGAMENRTGHIETASSGTLFLDEIGELPIELQTRLLRALETKEFYPLGAPSPRKSDFRLVAATNANLEASIKQGSFREDLYYRLNVFRVHVPPLREHKEDIKSLAISFAQKFAGEPVRLSAHALLALEAFDWPGNVRQLRNVVERATIVARGDVIVPEHIPAEIRCRMEEDGASHESVAFPSMEDTQKAAILNALEQCGGNRTHAARLLGISRKTILNRLKAYGIVFEPEASRRDGQDRRSQSGRA